MGEMGPIAEQFCGIWTNTQVVYEPNAARKFRCLDSDDPIKSIGEESARSSARG